MVKKETEEPLCFAVNVRENVILQDMGKATAFVPPLILFWLLERDYTHGKNLLSVVREVPEPSFLADAICVAYFAKTAPSAMAVSVVK